MARTNTKDAPPVSAPISDAAPPVGGVEYIHIKACFPSPLNPRKNFPETEIVELADSIAASGLLQPLTGREMTEMLENVPSAREIYIGGRRLRALDRLFESGRWPHDKMPGHLVPIIRRDVDDLQLLQVALAENLNRQDMHPLEEGEALAEFRRRGRSLDEVATLFGKTGRWVQTRIQVAEGLDQDTRKLFADGTINMDAARELVRLPIDVRKGHVAAIIMGDRSYRSAADIRDRIAEGLPEVERALFDLATYDGEFESAGRFHTTRRFADVAQFRKLQQAAIDAKEAEHKSRWSFVKVFHEKKKPSYFYASSFLSQHNLGQIYGGADPNKHGVVIVVFPDLSVEIIEGVCQGAAPPPPTKTDQKAENDDIANVSMGRRNYAQQRKTAAFQLAMLRQGRRAATEMMVMGLLGDGTAIGMKPENRGPENRHMAGELVNQLKRWHFELLGGDSLESYEPGTKGASAYVEFKSDYYNQAPKPRLKLFETIGTLADEKLDELFTLLVTARCGSFSDFQASFGNPTITVAMAERYGVNLQRDWQIDDAYVATMSRDQMHDLALKINSWCLLRDLPDLVIGDLQKMKVADMRRQIVLHVQANDVRLVPPEMRFASTKMVEADLRTWAAGKHGNEMQSDLTEMIDKAKDVAGTPVPATIRAVVRWTNRKADEEKELLSAVAAALPRHPDYGQKEIWLTGPDRPNMKLLLDAAHSTPGEYYIIGFPGSINDGSALVAANIVSTLHAWLATMTPAMDVAR